MIEKLVKIAHCIVRILCCIMMLLLLATFVFIVKAYYDGCEGWEEKNYNLWMEAKECQKQLEPYQKAQIIYWDDEYKVIRIEIEKE